MAATLAAVLLVGLAPLAAGCAPVHRATGTSPRGSPGAGSGPGRLRALGSAYRAADVAVEAQVRILRRALGRPAPESS